MILVEFFLAFRGIDWSSKDNMMENEWLIGLFRDFEQTATATSITGAAGSKVAQKWRTAYAWKWPLASRGAKTYNEKTCRVTWVKPIMIVFHFIKKVFDACGFSVITSSL